MSVQDHEDLVSEVIRLSESFAHMKTALDRSVAERRQILQFLDPVHRARETSSTDTA